MTWYLLGNPETLVRQLFMVGEWKSVQLIWEGMLREIERQNDYKPLKNEL